MENTFTVAGNKHCSFCGKKLKTARAYFNHGREVEDYHLDCECPANKKYLDIKNECKQAKEKIDLMEMRKIKRLQEEYSFSEESVRTLKMNAEIEAIRAKYGK